MTALAEYQPMTLGRSLAFATSKPVSAFSPQKLWSVFDSNHLDLWYSDTRTIALSRMMSFSMRIFRPCSWCARS